MKRSNNSIPNWYRILFLIVGISWIIWLSIENSSERVVLLFSVILCGLIALRFVIKYPAQSIEGNNNTQSGVQQSTRKKYYYPLIGAVTGMAVTPVAIFMMALKTGLHGHLGPDFSSAQMISVLFRTPIWIIGGILTGLGVSLMSWSQDKK